MTPVSPAAVLRLAESVPETPDNYPILRELIHALKDLTALTSKAKPNPVTQSCMTRLMDGRNEIRCWLPFGHEGECK